MYRSFCFLTLFASILTLVAYTVAPAQVDPAALREQHMGAIARGDVPGALALYTDDAIIDTESCGAAPCVGKAAIQKELERLVAAKTRATTIKNYVSGNVLTTRFEVRSDVIQKAAVERIIVWNIIEVKGDKISYTLSVPDRADQQTAQFLEWQRAQQLYAQQQEPSVLYVVGGAHCKTLTLFNGPGFPKDIGSVATATVRAGDSGKTLGVVQK